MVAKILVFGENKNLLEKKLIEAGHKLSNKPNLIIAFGGDGKLLESERLFPGIPKLLVKHSLNCKVCHLHDYQKVTNLLKNFKIKEFIKLEARFNGRKIIALNEIDIHNTIPSALRFQVQINKKIVCEEVIGDGILVSTAFGSTGYHYSITKKTFSKGLGLAFNNVFKTKNDAKNKVIAENNVIKIKIIRGPAFVVNDNDNQMIQVNDNDVIEIKKSKEKAKIIMVNDDYFLSFRKNKHFD